MTRDVMADVRGVLRDGLEPLTTAQLIGRLAGEHDAVAIEHVLEHFRRERLAERTPQGGWAWLGQE